MNPESQQLLTDALRHVLTSLTAGVDFAKQQIPLVLQEKLVFDFYYYLFFIFLWTLIWFVAGAFCVYLVKKYQRLEADPKIHYGENDVWAVAGVAPFICATGVWLAALGNNIPMLIQIKMAPRLYLMEWLRTML